MTTQVILFASFTPFVFFLVFFIKICQDKQAWEAELMCEWIHRIGT